MTDETPALSAQQRLDAALARIPYVRFLGLTCQLAGDEMTAILPARPDHIGNTTIPALHGGVVGAFMELTALAELMIREPGRRQPRTIDVTIDYLRPARGGLTTFARAEVRKLGRRIASVHVDAWQEARASPVAALRGHFMLSVD
ncbi:MAG TPA: PaaI family thioesterase [Caulobacteraceae bacterium]|nr:PaaI family thioesterase [Caulobacteraceae bacterium]